MVEVLFQTAGEERCQRVAESVPEVAVEVSVDDRIEGWVEVADPEESRHERIGSWTALSSAKRCYHIP